MTEAMQAVLAELSRRSPNNKALIGQQGWLYLINDTNRFLEFQFGVRKWTAEDVQRAAQVLRERVERISALGATYVKVIQPERSIVYKEFLPPPLCHFADHETRPAQVIEQVMGGAASYPLALLRQMKALGNLYFRGDTHLNWLGSFVLYRAILDQLTALGVPVMAEAVSLSDLVPSIASYGGDLYDQMDPRQRAELAAVQGPYAPNYGVEDLIEYRIRESATDYRRVEDDGSYAAYNERPLIITEKADRRLPRAVVFRGSGLTHVIPILGRHFSRCVYVWHKNLPYADIIERESPDVVLHVIAERFVWDTAEKQPLYGNP